MVAGRFDYLIGVETFKQLLMLPPSMTERAAVSTQLARIRQFDTVRDLFVGPPALAALDLPFVMIFLVLMWLLAGSIVLVPLSVIGIYVLLGLFFLPGLNKQVAASGAARSVRHRRLMDTFGGMRELKALGAESIWRDTCREAFSSSIMQGFKTARGHLLVNAFAHTLQTLGAIGVLGLGAGAVMHGEMSVGVLIAVMTLMWRILGPLQTLFLTYVKFDQVVQVIRQINQLMRLETEHHSARSTLLIPKIAGRIVFNRVSFRYSPKHDPALLGVSFSIEPGEMMAVIGGNGSGKSTVLKLIIGMYHPQAGTVSLDDLDLRQFNATDLRRVIAYTPQVPHLFYGTIEQNLRMADPSASRGQIERAAARAGVLAMIENEMPHGFDTRIGDRSTDRFPSGFIYGLCIARAYLRDTPILLLDEPSASLDRESDDRFMQQIEELKGSRTIVMVSHRPSHIRLADRAMTIEGGLLTDLAYSGDVVSRYLRART
jgi:ATP-binding cassette subfamily C protein/ATP-binding cassette subfamily C protein LapB